MNGRDFDRSFNRMRRFVKGFIIFVFVLMVAIVAAATVLGARFGKEVGQKGLRSVIERVWNGPVR